MVPIFSQKIKKYIDYKKHLRENIKYTRKLNQFAIQDLKKNKISRNCPLCTSSKYSFVFKAPVYEFVKCDECDLVYAKNTFKESSFDRFYKNNAHYQDTWKKQYRLLQKKKFNKNSKNSVVDKVLKFTKKRDKCLDIGCGFGEILFLLKPHFKSVEGVELNVFTSKKGSELFDLNIFNKDLNKLRLKKESYDCIILNQVIEHLYDFKMFSKINSLLKPGGILFIGCPNMDSLSMKLYKNKHMHVNGICHVNMFNTDSFKEFAKKYNFKIKYLSTDDSLDIWFNDLVSRLFKKRFLHRYNDLPFLNPINICVFFLTNWFFKITKILSKKRLGSYLEVVLEK